MTLTAGNGIEPFLPQLSARWYEYDLVFYGR
jgi:hypothetical protein